jgi:hypothetical protein
MMADGIFCSGGLTCLATSTGWLADVGIDVETSMDFCHFLWASASVEALRFAWVSATVGWEASALVDSGT